MTLICQIFGHAVAVAHYHHAGFEFALCLRCARDLFRQAGKGWETLPQGIIGASHDPPPSGDAAAMKHARVPSRRYPPRLRSAGGYDMRQRANGHDSRPGAAMAAVTGRNGTQPTRPAGARMPDGPSRAIYLPESISRLKARARDRSRTYRGWWLAHSVPPSSHRDRKDFR